jgi:ectoine hydroxylase-related dioxygenase (phytanoyl-CoA dioxygenase family)
MGPDIMLWTTNWFIKEANSKQYVSWHQDSNYWGLDTSKLVSVWIALSPATVASGCMRVLPGSHDWPDQEHVDTWSEDNMLTRGQSIQGLDESQAVNIEVPVGYGSIFTYRLLHASPPNATNDRRIAVVLRYVPPETRQTFVDWDSAALVRGEDRYGHFEHEPVPTADFDPAAVAFHARAEEAQRAVYYRGTEWAVHRT